MQLSVMTHQFIAKKKSKKSVQWDLKSRHLCALLPLKILLLLLLHTQLFHNLKTR